MIIICSYICMVNVLLLGKVTRQEDLKHFIAYIAISHSAGGMHEVINTTLLISLNSSARASCSSALEYTHFDYIYRHIYIATSHTELLHDTYKLCYIATLYINSESNCRRCGNITED